jgi:hypothetical protein
MIIFKNRDDTNVWATYHQGIGNNEKLVLNTNAAEDEDGSFMNGTLPTSSVFSVGASVNTNGSGDNYVAYCFASKQGYSKFGKLCRQWVMQMVRLFILDFNLLLLMIKCSTVQLMEDGLCLTTRELSANGQSYDRNYLVAANADHAESDAGLGYTDPIDLLSNGFKIRNSDAVYKSKQVIHTSTWHLQKIHS